MFTWSQTSVTYTVTASPWKNTAVKVTAAGTSSGSGASGTVAAAGATKTSNGAGLSLQQSSLVVGLPVLGVLVKMVLT